MSRNQPNILLIMPDQFRRHALSSQGGPIPTPHLDRLAQEGVSFTRAYCGYPMCTPSRAVLMTGRPCHALRSDAGEPYMFNDRQLDTTESTYARTLTAAGYRCAYIGKWHTDAHRGFIPPGPRRQGFEDLFMGAQTGSSLTKPWHFDDQGNRVGGDREMWEPDYQTDHAVAFLHDAATRREPFCLTISYNPPHAPYDVLPTGRKMLFERSGAHNHSLRQNVPETCRREARALSEQYHALVMGLDDCVGRLLQALDTCDLAKNTVVIFTSDHGDNLLSHGCRGKNQFWEEASGVPMLLRCPGILPSGMRVTCPVGQVDLAPTLIDLAGAEVPSRMIGRSLLPMIRSEESPEDACAFIEVHHPWWDWIHGQGWQGHRRCIVTTRWKLVVRETGRGNAEPEALYDLENDPFELTNLGREEAMIPTITQLGQRLLVWMARTDDAFFDTMLYGMDHDKRASYRDKLRRA